MTLDANDIARRHGVDHLRAAFDKAVTAAPSANGKAAAVAAATLTSNRASTFKMRGVRWFWPDRFAMGKLGLIGGLPEMGKGLISADIIARATTGDKWPCGEGTAPQGTAIWFSGEDAPEDTLVPRAAAAGADLDRVEIMQMMRNADGGERMFNLASDLPALEAKIDELGNVVLAIIDPVSAYLGVGKINTSSTTDVRGVLSPLTELAERKSLAVIGIMHFNKKADVTNAMLRIADSLAYVAAARHVYVVVGDADNPGARLFVKAKNNLAPDTYALRYLVGVREVGLDAELQEPIRAPHVIWDSEHVEITATQAMEASEGGNKSGAALSEAMDFLRGRLAMGAVPSTEIEEEARANGIAIKTLRRAREKLGINVKKEHGEIAGKWFWSLPTRTDKTP